MNTIQIPTKIILFIISSTTFSIVYGEQSILYRNNANEKISANSFEIPIPFQSKFQMNHSFSLSTSIINGKSQTKGIYSNLTHYNFSDRFNMQMKLHFIQNQSKSTLPYAISPLSPMSITGNPPLWTKFSVSRGFSARTRKLGND